MTYTQKKIKNLLIVEDDRATRYINEVFIGKTGLVQNVLIAKNGLEALNIVNSGIIPEIILLDLNMPISDGWDFLSHFYNDTNYSKSKIIIMLGETLDEFMLNNAKIQYGIEDFASKIISKSELSTYIEDYHKQKNHAFA